jgi:hypothetical protein
VVNRLSKDSQPLKGWLSGFDKLTYNVYTILVPEDTNSENAVQHLSPADSDMLAIAAEDSQSSKEWLS